jgi:hypothetical protein
VTVLGSQNESGNQDAENMKLMEAVSSMYVPTCISPSFSSLFPIPFFLSPFHFLYI